MTKTIIFLLLIVFNVLIGVTYWVINKKLNKLIRANTKEQIENNGGQI